MSQNAWPIRYNIKEGKGGSTVGEFDLERAVAEYGRELFARAYALLCDWQEAEDVVQEAFVAAYEHRAKLGGAERAWLYKVTVNKCLDRMRRKKNVSLEELGDAAPGVTDNYDAGYSPTVIRALSRLKPEQRAVVLWRVRDEMDYDEIARRLHTSEAAARKRCERAKKRLAEYLRDYNREEST